jgi:hypothetical protein
MKSGLFLIDSQGQPPRASASYLFNLRILQSTKLYRLFWSKVNSLSIPLQSTRFIPLQSTPLLRSKKNDPKPR